VNFQYLPPLSLLISCCVFRSLVVNNISSMHSPERAFLPIDKVLHHAEVHVSFFRRLYIHRVEIKLSCFLLTRPSPFLLLGAFSELRFKCGNRRSERGPLPLHESLSSFHLSSSADSWRIYPPKLSLGQNCFFSGSDLFLEPQRCRCPLHRTDIASLP